MANKTVQPRQPTREGQTLKREDERLRERSDAAILDGRLVELTKIAKNSSTKFKHGLGRKLSGYAIVRLKADAALTAPIREISMDENILELSNDTATDVQVALWVF